MSDPIIRPFAPHDLQPVLDLLAAAMPADPISEARFVRQVLLDPNFKPEGAPVAVRNDNAIGFALSIARQTPLENAPPDADRGYITLIAVAPAHQRQGIGGKLLAAAEGYLKSQNRSAVMVSSYAPNYFIPGIDVTAYVPALDFFTKMHGYAEVYRPIAMETSLLNWSIPQWIHERREKLAREGTIITPYKAEHTLPLLDFTKREFPGDWVRVVREAMIKTPSPLLIALDKTEIVGFAHHDRQRFGPIGVAQSQRGRGVGQILMFATLQLQREQNFRTAWFLWSDDKTAQRLYHAAGFKEIRRFALLKKNI